MRSHRSWRRELKGRRRMQRRAGWRFADRLEVVGVERCDARDRCASLLSSHGGDL